MAQGLNSFAFSFAVLALPFAVICSPLLLFCVEGSENEGAFASPLIESVFRVLSVRPEPQMCGIYASRIVARMTDALTLWNRAFEGLVDDSMSKAGFVAFVFPRDLAIALVIQGASVIPAISFRVHYYFEDDSLPRKEGFNNS